MPNTKNHIALDKQIEQLNLNIQKQLSFKRSFLMAVVYGVGYALGATIVAGIIITLLTWTIDSIHDIPVFGKLVSSGQINL